MIFPGSRRAAADTAVSGIATRPQVNEVGAGDSGDLAADTEPLPASRRLSQFAGRPIADLTQPLRVPKNLADLSGSGSRAARQLGELVIELIRAGRIWSGRLLAWAAERPIAPNSVTGIALLAALCAAAWFSGGSAGDDARGLLAVAVWAFARVGARQLAAATTQRERKGSDPSAGGQGKKRVRLAINAAPGQTDWLVLPGFNWTPDRPEPGRSTVAGQGTAEATAAMRKFAWLATVCTRAAECAIYGGIAAGAETVGFSGTWSFAVIVVIFVCAADIAQACSRAVSARSGGSVPPAPAGTAASPQVPAGTREPAGGFGSPRAQELRKRLAAVLTVPAGARVLVAAVLLVAYSPRMALFAVLVIASASLIRSIVRASLAWRAVSAAEAAAPPKTVLAAAAAGQDVILACRDDGALARWTGRWLLGNLMPLPPAVAGLTAILLLAWVGMRQLPGVVAFTPIVVLLLAAPGSSHPHDGRLDWLVPAVLCFGQFSFLAAFGLSRSVPDPIVFATCSLTAIWYAGIVAGLSNPAGPIGPDGPARAAAGAAGPAAVLSSRKQRIKQIIARKQPPGVHRIGWEGRVCLIAVAGMFGITNFGYLGLSLCLAVQICRKAFSDYLKPVSRPAPGEEPRQ